MTMKEEQQSAQAKRGLTPIAVHVIPWAIFLGLTLFSAPLWVGIVIISIYVLICCAAAMKRVRRNPK
jgi:uncharacterized protein (DUF983 family)